MTRFPLILAAALALALPARADVNAGAYLAARVAESGSDFQAARAYFALALQRDPKDRALLEGALYAQLNLGDLAGAAESSAALLASGGKSQLAEMALTAIDAQSEDYGALAAAFAGGRNVGPLVDQLVLAWAQVGDGQMAQALVTFDATAATEGFEAFGLYHKAIALALAGDFESADAILSGKVAGPINLNRRGVWAHVEILSQLERNDDALALIELAFGTEVEPALDALRDRLRAGEPLPFDSVRSARDGIAEVFFTVAAALNGDSDPSYVLLHSRLAATLRPDHTEALLLTAAMQESLGRYDLAVETYASFAPDHPAFYTAELGRADALHAAGRKDAAIEALQTLARNFPDLMLVHSGLGDMLRREERFAEAILAYDTAIRLAGEPAPVHWPLWFSRAICHERSGTWPLAEADFRQALALNPGQPQVLNYLGYSFVDRGENLDEALGMIRQAVAAEPESGYIIDSLAWAYFRLGRYEEALEPMERASVLEPVDPIVTDHLGDVYWAVGRLREAEFQWRRALSFEPTEKDAARIRLKLEIGLDAVLQQEGAPALAEVGTAANDD